MNAWLKVGLIFALATGGITAWLSFGSKTENNWFESGVPFDRAATVPAERDAIIRLEALGGTVTSLTKSGHVLRVTIPATAPDRRYTERVIEVLGAFPDLGWIGGYGSVWHQPGHTDLDLEEVSKAFPHSMVLFKFSG